MSILQLGNLQLKRVKSRTQVLILREKNKRQTFGLQRQKENRLVTSWPFQACSISIQTQEGNCYPDSKTEVSKITGRNLNFSDEGLKAN